MDKLEFDVKSLSNLFESLLRIERDVEAGSLRGGICHSLGHCAISSRDAINLYDRWVVRGLYDDWPHFSGSSAYPVPPPRDHAIRGYYSDLTDFILCEKIFLGGYPKWEGGYGELRKDLLQYLIKAVEEKLNEIR